MIRTEVQFDCSTLQAVDDWAADLGITRSALVARLVDEAVLRRDLRAIGESFGTARVERAPSGDRAVHLDKAWHLRG